MSPSSFVTNFSREPPPSCRRLKRSGSQIERRPAMSSSASSIVMTSSTCVAPPVGSGSAGSAMSSAKTIAKLRSPKTSMRLPSVFGASPVSQRSSCSLTCSSSGSGPSSPISSMVCLR